MNRAKHIVGLLGSIALAVLPLWADAQAPLAAKIAGSVSTGLALAFSLAKLKQYVNLIFGGLAVAGAIVAVIIGKLPAGTTGAVIGGTVMAVLTNLRIVFARDLGAVPGAVQPGGPTPVTAPATPAAIEKKGPPS